VCDACYEEHRPELTVVPGDAVVTARCDGCGTYGNPRQFAKTSPGGRKDAYSGTCEICAEEDRGGRMIPEDEQ
jgi:NMD protein affecting ribosome stability and mRNA decay